MKKLYLDLDDVVFDTRGTVREVRSYLNNHSEELDLELRDLDDAAWVYLSSNYDRVRVMPNFYDVLDLLRDSYSITFVSMYISEEEYAYKQFFARSLDLPIILLDVKKYKDKSSVDMSGGIFIDDNPSYLESSNASEKYLMATGIYWFLSILSVGGKYKRLRDWIDVGMALGVLDGKKEATK